MPLPNSLEIIIPPHQRIVQINDLYALFHHRVCMIDGTCSGGRIIITDPPQIRQALITNTTRGFCTSTCPQCHSKVNASLNIQK